MYVTLAEGVTSPATTIVLENVAFPVTAIVLENVAFPVTAIVFENVAAPVTPSVPVVAIDDEVTTELTVELPTFSWDVDILTLAPTLIAIVAFAVPVTATPADAVSNPATVALLEKVATFVTDKVPPVDMAEPEMTELTVALPTEICVWVMTALTVELPTK